MTTDPILPTTPQKHQKYHLLLCANISTFFPMTTNSIEIQLLTVFYLGCYFLFTK